MKEDEIVEYILVNQELEMGTGKIAGQVAHCQTLIDNQYSGTERYQEWLNDSMKKIILKGKKKDLLKWIEAGAVEVRDNGLTEIPANSLTVVGFRPMARSEMAQLTKRLRLLK